VFLELTGSDESLPIEESSAAKEASEA